MTSEQYLVCSWESNLDITGTENFGYLQVEGQKIRLEKKDLYRSGPDCVWSPKAQSSPFQF